MNGPTVAPYPVRRLIVGLLSLVCLAVAGSSMAVLGIQQSATFWIGLCTRIGLLFFAAWLAWDQLIQLAQRLPQLIVWLVILLVLVSAIRQRFFLVAISLIGIGLAVHFGLRLLRSGLR